MKTGFQRIMSLFLAVLTVVTLLPVMQLPTEAEAADQLPNQTITIPNVDASQKSPASYDPAETYDDVTAIVDDYLKVVGVNAYWNAGIKSRATMATSSFLKTITNTGCHIPRKGTKWDTTGLDYSKYASTIRDYHSTGKTITTDGKTTKCCTSNGFYSFCSGPLICAQCEGFAEYIAYVVFKEKAKVAPDCFTKVTGSAIKQVVLKPGDVIRDNGHSYMIWKIDESGTAYTINCNDTLGSCKIWSGKQNVSDIKNSTANLSTKDDALYSAPSVEKKDAWTTNVEVKLKSACNLYNGPMESSGTKTKTAFPKGTTGIATEIQKNESDNCWYQVTIGTETGWIYGGNCEVVGPAPDAVTVTDYTNLNKVEQGRTKLDLTEDLKAKNCTMTKVTGAFYSMSDSSSPKRAESADGPFSSFDLKTGDDGVGSKASNGKINLKLKPRELDLGVYKYTLDVEVKVKITDGKNVSDKTYTIKELLVDWFEVYKGDVKLTLDPTGGSCVLSQRTVEKNKAIGELPPATKANTKFLGWYTAKEGGTLVTKDSKFSSSATLYAHWEDNKYSVTYDANTKDKVSNMPSEQTKQKGENLPLSKKTPTRTGYTFDGWTGSDGNTYKAGSDYKTDAALTLKAKWKANAYTIQFNNNKGKGSMDKIETSYGESVTLTAVTFTRKGYTFTGWNTKKDGTGTGYKNAAQVKNLTAEKGKTVTLYAQWKANTYDVKFNVSPGTGAPEKQTKTHGDPLTLSETIPTRTGYTFDVWSGGGKDYKPGGKYREDESVTMTAQWEANEYKIEYQKNGGKGYMGKDNATYGKSVTLSKNKFKREGYEFAGWNTKNDGTGTGYKNEAQVKNLTAKDGETITLYAQWRKEGTADSAKTYKVTYNPNGGTGSFPQQTKKHNQPLTLHWGTPLKASYTFAGWKVGNTNEILPVGGSYTGNADVTLTATWNKADDVYNLSASEYMKLCKSFFSAGTLKISVKGAWFKSLPCSRLKTCINSEDLYPSAVPVGTQMTVTGLYQNSEGQYWYKATWNGQTGYISCDQATFTPAKANFAISGQTQPTTLTSGNGFDVKGTVTSQVYPYQVTGTISDRDGQRDTQSVTSSGSSCNLYSIKCSNGNTFNWNLSFGQLKIGDCNYTVTADVTIYYSTDGRTLLTDKQSKTLIDKDFKVVGFGHTVTFVSGDDQNKTISTKKVYDYEEFTVPRMTYERDGYEFLGYTVKRLKDNKVFAGSWMTETQANNAGKTLKIYEEGSKWTLEDSWTTGNVKNSDYQFTGVWKKLPTYTVTYNANGGTGAPAAQTESTDRSLYLSSTVPTRTGYTFLGWSDSRTATEADYVRGELYTDREDITLYAVWKIQNYTITYDANGGTGVPAAQTETVDKNLYLSSTVPTRTGYVFLGWSNSRTATEAEYAKGELYTGRKDITLYAVWRVENYTISYNANGGTGTPAAQTGQAGTTLEIPMTLPVWEGHVFQGWGLSADADYSEVTHYPGDRVTMDKNLVLYAVWTEIKTYTVTYDANGGTGAPAAQTKTHGQALTLSTTKPTREGYTFLGWASSKTATKVQYAAGSVYKANAALMLYAVWEADAVDVYLMDNHGKQGWIIENGTAMEAENAIVSGLSHVTVTFNLSENILKRYPDAANWAKDHPVSITEYNIPVQMQNLTLDFYLADGTYDLVMQSTDSYVAQFTQPVTVRGDTSIEIDLYELVLNFNGGKLQLGTTEVETLFSYYIYENFDSFACAFGRMPVREGYKLLGWDRDADALTPEYSLNFHEHLFFDRDLELYAVWQDENADNAIYVVDNTQVCWAMDEDGIRQVYEVDISGLNHVVLTMNPSDAIRQRYPDLEDLPEYHNGVSILHNDVSINRAIWMEFVDQKVDFYISDSELNYVIPTLGTYQFEIIQDQELTLELCQVMLDLNGGQWSDGTEEPEFYHAIVGRQRSYSSYSGPIRDGYTFLGWSEDPNSTTAEYKSKFFAAFETDKVLYAVWEKQPALLVYDQNADTYWNAEEHYVEQISAFDFSGLHHVTVTMNATDMIQNNLSCFDEWYLEINDSGHKIPLKMQNLQLDFYISDIPESITLDCDEIAYIGEIFVSGEIGEIELDIHNLTFEGNGGFLNGSEVECFGPWFCVNYPEDIYMWQSDLERSGYIFRGWSLNPDATQAEFVEEYLPGDYFTEDTTLYAVWEKDGSDLPMYTITYDANGGEGGLDKDYANSENPCMLTTDIPSREGYVFDGWAESPDAQDADYQPGDYYWTSSDCTLYAIWKEESMEE